MKQCNPLRIEQYGAKKNVFTAFTKTSNKFVGWIKGIDTKYEAMPSNNWENIIFDTKQKAIRYLISSLK